ncbi:hypothetical protein ACLOJK_027981 [Asimina triloba]
MATTPQHRERLLTEEERQVAEILLQLPKLHGPLRSLSAIRWGSKRRRSSFPTAPSPPCGRERILLKAEAASPATPLSFSPSDADEYSRPKISRRRDPRKKSHRELKEEVAGLSAERIKLEQEYAKRSKYWNELQALNLRLISQLKETQNQLSLPAFYQPHLSRYRRSSDLIGNLTVAAAFQANPALDINHLLLRPSTEDATPPVPNSHEGQQQPSLALIMPSGPGLGMEENHSMAVGILDLNSPPKEAISFDFTHIPARFNKNKAAISAEARKRRMEINRGKSSLALKQ